MTNSNNATGDAGQYLSQRAARTILGIEALISEAQVAKLLGVSLPSIYRWRLMGVAPPFIALGPRRIAYKPSDVLAWLEARKRTEGVCDDYDVNQHARKLAEAVT
jgi:predicted DNA-binding transcriptional regulator AlpA